jgi:hypothetical protein
MKANKPMILLVPLMLLFAVGAIAENLQTTSDTPPPGLIIIADAKPDQSTIETSDNASSEDGLSDENTVPLPATLVLIAAGLFGAALLGRRPSPRP